MITSQVRNISIYNWRAIRCGLSMRYKLQCEWYNRMRRFFLKNCQQLVCHLGDRVYTRPAHTLVVRVRSKFIEDEFDTRDRTDTNREVDIRRKNFFFCTNRETRVGGDKRAVSSSEHVLESRSKTRLYWKDLLNGHDGYLISLLQPSFSGENLLRNFSSSWLSRMSSIESLCTCL